MASIVVLSMSAAVAHQGPRLQALRESHEVVVVEPRWPECQTDLEATRPGLVVVDASHSPSHGRTVAGWMATHPRFRTVPFLFLDVVDREVGRVKKAVPRAQFASWGSVVGSAERLIKR